VLNNFKYKQKVLFILVLVFAVISVGLLIIYNTEHKSLVEQHRLELDERFLLAQNALDLRAREMKKLITVFQTNRPLIEYLYITTVLGGEAAPLADMLDPFYKPLAIDTLTLYNARGDPVLRLDKKLGLPAGNLKDRFPEFPKKIVHGFLNANGTALITGAGPLEFMGAQVGYIELGKYMDSDYLAELKMLTGGELLLVRGDGIVSSSLALDDASFRPKNGKYRHKGGVYSIKERELKDLRGAPIGRLVMGLSDKRLSQSLRKLSFYMFLIVGASMAIAFGLGALLIKALVNPLSGMASFVENIGEGRFDRKLQVRGKDEIAVLSGRFNLMQEQLKEHREKLKAYADNLERLVEERTIELRKVERQLLQSQKMESLGALAGGIAHDFNNVLSAILGYASFAKESIEAGDPQYRYWDIVEKAAARGAELTSHLLTFSKGKAEPGKKENIDVNRLLGELSKLLEKSFDKKIDIEIKPHPGRLFIYGENTSIYQALLNICINARDAMPDGGRLIIETAPFMPSDRFRRTHPNCPEGQMVKIDISDTGVGIDREIIDRIFEPFFSTKEAGKGTGLGLAIVYGIIKNHGGFIDVYSEVGHGTTFKIYIPAVTALEEKPAEEPVLHAVSAASGQTVLVVDDEEPVRNLYREVLEAADYKVLTAGTGDEAISIYQANKDHISLAILDLVLPGMSGHEIFKALKETSPGLKVIVSSGYSPELGLKWIDKEIDGFVQKPFNAGRLLRQIKEILR